MRARMTTLIASILGAALLAASPALGAPPPFAGGLSQPPGAAGCVQAAGSFSCAGAVGLDNPRGVAVSPDGKNVYATASGGPSVHGAVVVFSRNGGLGGVLQQRECSLADHVGRRLVPGLEE